MRTDRDKEIFWQQRAGFEFLDWLNLQENKESVFRDHLHDLDTVAKSAERNDKGVPPWQRWKSLSERYATLNRHSA